MRITFVFDTTHHALWAEEIAREQGIPNEVVPSPPEAHARCNIALELLAEDRERMADALDAAEVPHRVHNA